MMSEYLTRIEKESAKLIKALRIFSENGIRNWETLNLHKKLMDNNSSKNKNKKRKNKNYMIIKASELSERKV